MNGRRGVWTERVSEFDESGGISIETWEPGELFASKSFCPFRFRIKLPFPCFLITSNVSDASCKSSSWKFLVCGSFWPQEEETLSSFAI